MGYEKKGTIFLGGPFFFWCSRINLSDKAKRGLYCDKPLEEPFIGASQPTHGHAAKRNQDITLGCG